MKPVLKTSLISVASAIIGGGVVFAAMTHSRSHGPTEKPSAESVYDDILSRQKGIQHEFDNLFDDDFFSQRDPFEEMKKMRQQMEKRMEQFGPNQSAKGNPFDFWFTDKFGGSINDISRREDDDFVYYDIKVDDINATSINTKIENGSITISGSLEKKGPSAEGSAQSVYKSTFNRTFPLPEGIDPNKMQMVPDKDKIVLKFPKLKS